MPKLSRRQLSSKLDDSKHLLKENKYTLALDLTTSVIESIVPKKSDITASSEDDDSDAMDAMESEDLLLMAKALCQKGKITESCPPPGRPAEQECLSAYTEVST